MSSERYESLNKFFFDYEIFAKYIYLSYSAHGSFIDSVDKLETILVRILKVMLKEKASSRLFI